MAGFMKTAQPINKLARKIPWVLNYPRGTKWIGIAEVLGGLGLILPSATGIATILTPVAGMGLAVIMAMAAIFHIQRNEMKAIPINAVLFLLCGVIVCGRI